MIETKKSVSKKSTKYTKRSDLTEYKSNPFAMEMLETIQTGKKVTGFAAKNVKLMDEATGELLGESAVIGIKKIVDKEQFIKFFGAGLVSAFELTKTAQDTFLLVLKLYIEVNTIQNAAMDQIYVNFDIAVDEGKYKKTRPTFTSGLNQLIAKKFIAPVKYKKDWYWLNPNLFVKGNRVTLMQHYVIQEKVVTGDDHKQQSLLE